MNKLLTTASLVALMALPAIAQDATTPPPAQNAPAVESPAPAQPADQMSATHSGDISAKALLDESVKNAANESIGDINDVLIGSDGKIAAVIVGVGGFLGMGEKNVALPFDQLVFAKDADDDLIVNTTATKESLQAAPEYTKPEDRS
jgi:hypothetical protein